MLEAAPEGGSTFTWSGARMQWQRCMHRCHDRGSDRDGTFTATAPPPPMTLTVTIGGMGVGTVTSNPSGISCPGTCSAGFAPGTTVALTATPRCGSIFAGWSGDCSGTDPARSLWTRIGRLQPRSIRHLPDMVTLTVQKRGPGDGTVTFDPAGISCGDTCQASYPRGTVVTLTATPMRLLFRWVARRRRIL